MAEGSFDPYLLCERDSRKSGIHENVTAAAASVELHKTSDFGLIDALLKEAKKKSRRVAKTMSSVSVADRIATIIFWPTLSW